jgi:hypothetical protein
VPNSRGTLRNLSIAQGLDNILDVNISKVYYRDFLLFLKDPTAGVSFNSPEDGNRSSFRSGFVVFRIPDDGEVQKSGCSGCKFTLSFSRSSFQTIKSNMAPKWTEVVIP